MLTILFDLSKKYQSLKLDWKTPTAAAAKKTRDQMKRKSKKFVDDNRELA